MARKWSLRLLALGGLAVAFGCRTHPNVPPCTTPLLPGEVVPGPVNQLPGPPVPGSPPLGVKPTAPPGAQLSIQPPKQFTKLPESTYPEGKPQFKPVEPTPPTPPTSVTDLPPILPPKDVKPLLTGNPKTSEPAIPLVLPAPGASVKPPLTEVTRPTPSADGFGPAPRVPISSPVPVLDLPPLPLKSGEKYGHAADYRWLAGVVDWHVKGKFWMIRYADIGADDLWGGKVRLLDDDRLRDLRDGDVVYVEGELMAPKSAAEGSAFPPFRVTSVRVIERAR
jgi:hypothetical protein